MELEFRMNEDAPIAKDGLAGLLDAKLMALEIDKALTMFVNHSEEAEQAISEYKTSEHLIMRRLDKKRKNKEAYRTNKLPLPEQKRINEINLFFMFGNPLKFYLANDKKEKEELQPVFDMFQDFLKKTYFNERMREAKRLAGCETECAKLYEHYTDENNKIKVKCRVLANSKKDKMYTLFNKYGDLIAFAHGYFMRDQEMSFEQHLDVYTSSAIYECCNKDNKWSCIKKENPFKKIPVVYYNQEKEWEGVQERIDRLEWLESKGADTTEYFNDPYLKISKELVNNRLADAEEVGKAIKVDSKDTVFEFVTPPDAGELMQNEKKDIKNSILEGTFTPDFSYASIKGLGTLSAEAIQKMALPGYIKLAMRREIYDELINREINLVIGILKFLNLGNSQIVNDLDRLKVEFEFQDPFSGSFMDNAESVQYWMTSGAMSKRTAVEMNNLVKDKDLEVERIFDEMKREKELESLATRTDNIQNNNEEE